MIIHEDDQSNIFKEDCLEDESVSEKVKEFKPTIGPLNPPYNNKVQAGIKELKFILYNKVFAYELIGNQYFFSQYTACSYSSRQEIVPEKLQPEAPQLPLPLALAPLPPLPLLIV